MKHPHPDKAHVVRTYRRYLLGVKKLRGSARSLIHYHDLVATYREAKQEMLKLQKGEPVLENVEITVSYQEWPKVRLILKHGVMVKTVEARFDQAVEKFTNTVREFFTESMDSQTTRRKQHGTT